MAQNNRVPLELVTGVGRGFWAVDLPAAWGGLFSGRNKARACAPPGAPPLLIYNIYVSNPVGGQSSASGGAPPLPADLLAINGGTKPTPDELAHWAEVYGCRDEVAEEFVPDPGDKLERDTVVLSHWDCDAPLAAIGYQNGADGTPSNPDALPGVWMLTGDLFERMAPRG